MILAPISVVLTLHAGRSVWLTFAIYHLTICLLVPYLAGRRRDLGRRVRLEEWGLRRSASRAGASAGTEGSIRVWLIVGAGLGAAAAGVIVGGFMLLHDGLLAGDSVWSTLREWGVTRKSLPTLFAVMLAGNGAAEELFWRGWLHSRLAPIQPRTAAIALAAICYASYHTFTVASLLRSVPVTASFTLAIFVVACFWGWMRERSGSVWPALLCHVGATAGYMTVLWRSVVSVGGHVGP